MQLDAYTDDAICGAMGLGQFEPARIARAIRLLLKPSFHPEVCITLEPTRLQAVVLRSMLWYEPVPCRLPEYAEVTLLAEAQFDRVALAFERALAENAKEETRVCLDGMSVSALQINGDRTSRFDGHHLGSERAQFVADLLRLAHASASSVHLRNRIAECGRYVDQTVTIEPEPELPNVTRFMVLGAPEDRADYFNQLQRKTAARPPR